MKARRGFFRIDGHVHGNPADFKGSAADYVRKMRRLGLSAAVLIEEGAVALAAARRFGDFIIPVARVRMDRSSPAEIDRWLAAGCRGIKFIAPLRPYSEKRYWPLYRAVDRRGAVAVFHTGYLGLDAGEMRLINMQHMRAAEIDLIARRFPGLRMVMAHFSNPWWEEAWKVSWSNPNVYADLSGGTALRRSMLMWRETFAPNGELMENSLRKLIFASDKVYFNGGESRVPAHIEFYEKLLDAVKAPPDLRARVWGGTARELFGLKLRAESAT